MIRLDPSCQKNKSIVFVLFLSRCRPIGLKSKIEGYKRSDTASADKMCEPLACFQHGLFGDDVVPWSVSRQNNLARWSSCHAVC
jgi:hypothetical protein